MLNGRKRVFARIAGSMLLATASLVTAPAPAQTGDPGWNDPYCCNVNGCGWGTTSGPGWGYDCCYYNGSGWYSLHSWGTDACYIYPPFQSPDEADDRVSKERTQPSEQ